MALLNFIAYLIMFVLAIILAGLIVMGIAISGISVVGFFVGFYRELKKIYKKRTKANTFKYNK